MLSAMSAYYFGRKKGGRKGRKVDGSDVIAVVTRGDTAPS
jgi:hypothetical protein